MFRKLTKTLVMPRRGCCCPTFVRLNDVYILSATRTPMGSYQGAFQMLSATQLGAAALKGALEKACIPLEDITEVYMGNVLSAGVGQAPARQAAIYAGMPTSTICTTVNKVCSSGMKAVMLAAQSIQTGVNCAAVGGGMESMSNVPYYLKRGCTPYGGVFLPDGIVHDGLTDVYKKIHMGSCGEKTAKEQCISREQQDEFAIASYTKSAEATKSGAFQQEIVPIAVKSGGQEITVCEDEEFKKVNFDKLKKLKPVFQKEGGTITAGNASTINDGGAAVVLASGDYCRVKGIAPLAKVVAFTDAECEPVDFPLAPALAIPKLLTMANCCVENICKWEINEAFSVVVLAAIKALKLDPARVNVHGGAVSMGHPIGMSGARIVVHLAHSLCQGELGVAAICNGGGGASAIMLQKLGVVSEGLPRITLYTKHPCPLCDDVKAEMAPFQGRFALQEVDIEAPGNEAWRRLYRYEIPVLFLDGRFLCKHRLDAAYFRARLEEAERARCEPQTTL